MREVLKALMAVHGDSPYDLHTKSGITAATTYRCLSGKHGDPKSATIRQWAKVYGVTEGQLRGLEPIKDINATVEGPPKPGLANLLSAAEYTHIMNLRKVSKESQGYVYKLVLFFLKELPHPCRRAGEAFYAPVIYGKLRRSGDKGQGTESLWTDDAEVNNKKRHA